ncbi:ABC-2 type transport system permease protein [Chitinophaga terrae (ex Kim and Jung 2007)]|uniref:ABC-2 type transport system permease protein n=1 Tax=Chitinophaga terrae (ex Kim and Jung 2007) TaxID=408074 RepID=A0A1H4BB85_9BACT|nr:ABC transporter permease [Chitinophaga terrae (ex Kim and Jung 2007)]MDQ0106239.1 ABC-2 type transport system permease protein [Chitinophaga terrae (ex Kim and Jung 2007)]GEP92121.1 ABC transporter permease [Chitinophaga terrae (ex Kim and Jung 2007)]SEA45409.1 ABC-2 type transport system permease protein [Chitinophaga terrae (ex Kim and Jung 2007)]
MKVLGYLLQKEFKQIFRDKTILAMMFAMPTIQLIILPLAMNFDVKRINLAVVDHDHSTYSSRLINKINASGYFRLVAGAASFGEAIRYVETEKADVVLEIPQGFERNLVREGQQPLGISVDAINGTKAAIGGNYLLTVISDYNREIPVNANGFTKMNEIEITWSNWFNPLAEYRFYIVPAVLVLLLTLIGGFMSALNIVREKEAGTIEQINVTPIKKWQFISGKLIPFWVVGMIVFTLGLLIAWAVYGIWPVGSLLTIYAFAAIYLVALLGFGLLISTYTENQLQAMFVAFFFMMIFMLMSGLFTAVDSMPRWARIVANLTPVTHFIKVIRMVVLKGSSFADVGLEFAYLVGFAGVLNGWAIFNYRKTS